MLIWFDLETTGLTANVDKILEVGIIITNDALVIQEQENWIIRASDEDLGLMDDYVRDMHTNNGLLEALRYGVSLDRAEDFIVKFLDQNCAKYQETDDEVWTMAGSSVWFDRKFLAHWMPKVEKKFHHRMMDVSSVKILFERFAPNNTFTHDPFAEHRALGDLYGSIAELRYYHTQIRK